MYYVKVIMERAKNYAIRAFAFALACFVVAFSVSVPSFALNGSDLSGTASLDVAVYYPSGSYDYGSMSLPYPYDGNGGYMSPSLTLEPQSIVRTVTEVYFDLSGGYTYRLHVRFCGMLGNIDSQYINVWHYNGAWNPFNYTLISFQKSTDASSYVFDVVVQFDLPLSSTRFRIILSTYTSGFETSSSAVSGVGAVDFLDIDPVTDQTTGDKIEVDRVDGSVNDKTDESDSLLGEIGSVSKPFVNVNPMQGMDLNAFRAFTNILSIPFESPYIVWMFVTMLSFSLIAYVLFGKGG